jgi:membrane protein implicated in regulation of membrane protease activity
VILRPRGGGESPIPKHPYRDSVIVNAGLSVLLLLIAWLTGGDLSTALVVAVAFFLVATAWNWWRFSRRIAEREAQSRRPPE